MKKYLITLLIAITCFQMAHAQTENYLLYKEYAPDYWVVLTPENHFDIDIDDDGIADVRYEVVWGVNGHNAISETLTINGWLACSYCTFNIGYENVFSNLSIPLNDTSLVWGELCLFESLVQHPNTDPLVYKVSLRLQDGEDYYYGWGEFEEIREASYDRGRFRVVRTCYCAIPNYPLVWGQTSLTEDVGEYETTTFAALHPNPTNSSFTITGNGLKTAEVLNTLGQQVATSQGQGETIQVDITNLPAGIYFVRITDEEGRKCVRKVVKE